MTEELKTAYKSIVDKVGFCDKIAGQFKVTPRTIYTNWFGRMIGVPLKFQKEVLRLLKEENTLQEAETQQQ